jgi:aminoglycoside phosphotransferase (APT) family kinase protein
MTRPAEDLAPAALDWLRANVAGLSGVPRVTQYSGGASNWTYRLEYETRDLVLRRPPAGTKAKSAHDMGREYRIQRALKPVFPTVPAMVAHCDDASVIGCEFYVMERVPGIILRKNPPAELHLDIPGTRALCLAVIDTLVALHQVDAHAAGLLSLGRGPGYARRQIEGWCDRYAKARTWNVPTFAGVTEWLRAEVPDDAGACVIHNDFRFDNVVLDPAAPTRVVSVLDWEMATIGCPLMDLGGALAYWVQADDDPFTRAIRRQPTHLPGMLTRQEVIAHYLQRMGLPSRDFTFYEVYGLFRLAGIAQQIYYRYHHGETRNPAFRWFWVMVRYLHWRCRRLIRAR